MSELITVIDTDRFEYLCITLSWRYAPASVAAKLLKAFDKDDIPSFVFEVLLPLICKDAATCPPPSCCDCRT
jgi:hypothetical protein